MTAAEIKAKELVEKFSKIDGCYCGGNPMCDCPYMGATMAKECALIVVEEVLYVDHEYYSQKEFWQEVKQSIKNINYGT